MTTSDCWPTIALTFQGSRSLPPLARAFSLNSKQAQREVVPSLDQGSQSSANGLSQPDI